MFGRLKNLASSAMDDLNRAVSGDQDDRGGRLRGQLREVELELGRHRARLEGKLKLKFENLYPKEPVSGAVGGRYPDLDPLNFVLSDEESWLVSVASGVIERFPGSATLLSQLDGALNAFAEANYLRVLPGGPHSELLAARDRILDAIGLDQEIPIYVSNGGGNHVQGCNQPFVSLDRLTLLSLDAAETEALLATKLGHVFFGNLRIFAFYQLMSILDKMPSVAGLLQKGLGMIPGFGNTISKGFEIARTLNDNLIRKSNLVIGLQTLLRGDRLALLCVEEDALRRLHLKLCYGEIPEEREPFEAGLLSQGAQVHELFEAGKVNVHMLSILQPSAVFAPYRAFKLQRWAAEERAGKIAAGYYVTREKVSDFARTHSVLEREIRSEETRIYELEEEAARLRQALEEALAAKADEPTLRSEGAGVSEEAEAS